MNKTSRQNPENSETSHSLPGILPSLSTSFWLGAVSGVVLALSVLVVAVSCTTTGTKSGNRGAPGSNLANTAPARQLYKRATVFHWTSPKSLPAGKLKREQLLGFINSFLVTAKPKNEKIGRGADTTTQTRLGYGFVVSGDPLQSAGTGSMLMEFQLKPNVPIADVRRSEVHAADFSFYPIIRSSVAGIAFSFGNVMDQIWVSREAMVIRSMDLIETSSVRVIDASTPQVRRPLGKIGPMSVYSSTDIGDVIEHFHDYFSLLKQVAFNGSNENERLDDAAAAAAIAVECGSDDDDSHPIQRVADAYETYGKGSSLQQCQTLPGCSRILTDALVTGDAENLEASIQVAHLYGYLEEDKQPANAHQFIRQVLDRWKQESGPTLLSLIEGVDSSQKKLSTESLAAAMDPTNK